MLKKFKYYIKELIKIYSTEDSYFSKKRIESGIAFIIMEWGMIHWLILNVDKCTSSDIVLWASLNAAISGYVINQIQKEKKLNGEG